MTPSGHLVYCIVAVDEQMGIGKDRALPWRFKKEMAYFKQRTITIKDSSKQNMVIMGRTTWESIPAQFRPLEKRKNVVLSREGDYEAPGASVTTSIDAAFATAGDDVETIYVIGGARVFATVINDPRIDGLYITKIHRIYDCDTFLPPIPPVFSTVTVLGSDEENGIAFDYLLYTR